MTMAKTPLPETPDTPFVVSFALKTHDTVAADRKIPSHFRRSAHRGMIPIETTNWWRRADEVQQNCGCDCLVEGGHVLEQKSCQQGHSGLGLLRRNAFGIEDRAGEAGHNRCCCRVRYVVTVVGDPL
jgi:hypothetical protein